MAGLSEDQMTAIDDTWPRVLKRNYEKYGDKIAMRSKTFGLWRPYTWEDYYINVKYLALGLLALGFETEDKVAIIGDNAPQWYYAELAAQANHGASVGIYSDLTPPEVRYIVQNSDAKFAIIEDQEQVDKFLEIKDELPLLKEVIYWDPKGLIHYDDSILISYQQVLQLGKEYEETHSGLFERNVETGNADDICALVYTSGTTGAAPKGAAISHRQLRCSAQNLVHNDQWQVGDNVVSYLPPAWVAEQWFGIGCHLLSGCTLNFPEGPETQQQDIREIGPDMIFYGARLWEAQAAMVQAKIIDSDTLKRFSYHLLLPIGYKMADLEFEKKAPSLFWRILYAIANIFLFRPSRDSLGLSKARTCLTAGAMLSPDAFRFYHALNLRLKSMYGSTEGGFASSPRTTDIKPESQGLPNLGVEVRITNDGEILNRQEGTFSGYYKAPEKTTEVVKDGWFYSGDGGFIDDDGHIIFMDRLKDLVELASGDKLAPQYVESRLKFSPYIKDAWVVVGRDKTYPAAVIVIDYDNVGRWAEQRRIPYTTFADLSQKPEVYDLIKRDIARVNRALLEPLRIRKYANLHKEFDPDEAELTRTRKLRRGFMEERYAEMIGALYSDKKELPVVAQVKYRDGRVGTIKTVINIKQIGEETG
mgnify:CR=1 FL=1